MAIHQIFEIPGMEQMEGTKDYSYPKEYQRRLCKYQDKYILFKERSYDEFPCELIDIILQTASENQVESITKEQVDMKMSDIISNIHDISAKSTNDIIKVKSEIRSNINSLEQKLNLIISDINHLQSPETVQAIVSKELTAVYENYEKVIKQLIQTKAEELAKEIKDAGNKLDPMNVAMFKKLGMEISEIIQLAKAGLL
ncbi:MAG: hypothetical protein H8D97_00815 [Proteobacteria bacterium]|nr:hypothetical protein [Pseudomonadota bacterium]